MVNSIRQRSPNYPAADLATSIRDVQALYSKNGRSQVGLEPAVKALGFKALSGPSRSRLGALRQYGLVEGTGGTIKPSDLGLVFCVHAQDTNAYKQALHDAALNPEIFKELAQSHMDAGEDALRYYLETARHFSKDGAKILAGTFRSAMRLAGLGSGSYDQDMTTQAPSSQPTRGAIVPGTANLKLTYPPNVSVGGGGDGVSFSWPLSESRIAEVVFHGGLDGEEDLDALIDYLEVVRKQLRRRPKQSPADDDEST